MNYSKIQIIVATLAAVILTGCGGSSALTLDGTSQETMKQSMRAMSDTLPEEEQKKLVAAAVKISLSVIGGLATPTEEDQKKIRDLVHGKTAQEIINYADSIKETTAAKNAIDLVNKIAEEDKKPKRLRSIHVACGPFGGGIDIVKQHVTAGTDLNARDAIGRTPLMLAAKNGHKEIAELLIANGATINMKGGPGDGTPLHEVIDGEHKEILQLLLANGGDVNAKDKYGKTALLKAVNSKNTEMLELLIAGGADVNVLDKYGKTPLDNARRYPENAKTLIKNGAKKSKELKLEGK